MGTVPHVILEFLGGSEDGAVYDDSAEACIYYQSSDFGRLGARFRVIPDYTFHRELQKPENEMGELRDEHFEIYEIIEHREEWDHVYLRANYLGRETHVSINVPERRLGLE